MVLGEVYGSQQWINTEGQTIEASFVRLSLAGNSVVIQQDRKVYEVELSRLSPASREQALRLHEKKTEWAAEEVLKPLLTEEVLVELLKFNRQPLIGKHLFVNGQVAKILQPGSITSTQPRLELALGTVSMVDFSSYGVPGKTELRISPDRVTLVWPGKSKEKDTELLRVGQAVTIQVRIDSRDVAGLGLADPVEVRKARNSPASRSFAAYLSKLEEAATQAALASPPEPSPPMAATEEPPEKSPEAPVVSAPPSPAPNAFLQWVRSLLGQGDTKPSGAP